MHCSIQVQVTVRKLVALFALAGLVASCSSREPDDARAKNLVLITVDTLRADHLQSYGYFRETAPHIDALAGESMVFERCFAPIAQTTPSHLSLMTGLYPFQHGVADNFASLPAEVQRERAFAPSEVLQSFAQIVGQGVHTAGFVSAAPVKSLTGLANGFQTWDEPETLRRRGLDTNVAAIAWLNEHTGPFFMWVHYMDAHGPYAVGIYPPDEILALYPADAALATYLADRGVESRPDAPPNDTARPEVLTNLYDGSVRMADEAVGELLDALRTKGVWEETAVVLMSDHGQGLWQHYSWGHGDVWDEQLRVPLMVRVPGRQPERLDPLMSIIDVLPTALRFVDGFPSADFTRQARGKDVFSETFTEPAVFGMGDRFTKTFSLTDENWKVVLRPDGTVSLFDRRADPFELNDVFDANQDRAESMRSQLTSEIEAQRRTHESFKLGASTGELVTDEQHLDELGGLGYSGEDQEDVQPEDSSTEELAPIDGDT